MTDTAAFGFLHEMDVDTFHMVELPQRLAAGNNALAAAANVNLKPLTFDVDGSIWTYVPSSAGLELVPGPHPDAHVVKVSNVRFAAYVEEFHTGVGLLMGQFAQGDVGALVAWEPVVRAAFHGRPIYNPALVDVADLDLGRRFTLDDDPVVLAQHLNRVGFVHIANVFDQHEIQQMRSEIDRLSQVAVPGDDRSWWAQHADGESVLCRMTFLQERSEVFQDLHLDPRLVDLASQLGHPTAVHPDRHDGFAVVIKKPNIVNGLSDLPWHIDCGLGGHPVLCPGFNVGIQLDAATAETGQLHFLAGSHTMSSFQLTADELLEDRFTTVSVETQPGDITIHFTDVLHAAPPPSGEGGRRVVYLSFHPPEAAQVIPPGKGYNDVVLRDQQ